MCTLLVLFSLENRIHVTFTCSWSLSNHPHNTLEVSRMLAYKYPSSLTPKRANSETGYTSSPEFPIRIKVQLSAVGAVLVTCPLFAVFLPCTTSPLLYQYSLHLPKELLAFKSLAHNFLLGEPRLRHNPTELLSFPVSNFVDPTYTRISLTYL